MSSFGDFNSLEEAAAHLPAGGGELCLLPGLHRANLRLEGRRNVKIHGCSGRSLVLPRTETRVAADSASSSTASASRSAISTCSPTTASRCAIDGSSEGSCRDLRIHDNRMIARTNAIRATNAADLVDRGQPRCICSTPSTAARRFRSLADDVLIERNTLVLLPFVDQTPDQPDEPDDDPTRDPADPCARPQILYAFPRWCGRTRSTVWTLPLAQLVPQQPYRAIGGIHVRAGSERVRILENQIVGGAGNGITLGGDLDPAESTAATAVDAPRASPSARRSATARRAPPCGQRHRPTGNSSRWCRTSKGRALPDVDVYLEADAAATDRSDAQGMASVKAAPGAYTLDVAPAVSRRARDRGARRRRAGQRGHGRRARPRSSSVAASCTRSRSRPTTSR